MEEALLDQQLANATNYPRLSYLSGFMTVISNTDKGPFNRCCDECGVLVDDDC